MTFTRPVNSEFTSLAVGCVLVGISLCNQTFVNSTDQNTFWPCFVYGYIRVNRHLPNSCLGNLKPIRSL